MGYHFILRCGYFSDAIAPQRQQVDAPTWLLIHPLGVLLCARVPDDRELCNLTNDGRGAVDASKLIAKLLRTRYPRTLKIGLAPSAQSKGENGHLD